VKPREDWTDAINLNNFTTSKSPDDYSIQVERFDPAKTIVNPISSCSVEVFATSTEQIYKFI
jgi:hypothetical protein